MSDKKPEEAPDEPAGTAPDSDESPAARRRPPRPCPICSKLSTEAAWPFCSKRCADVDLNRWFKGSYTVPVVELDDIDPEDVARGAYDPDDD